MDRFLHSDYYRFIFENSYDAILLTSPDGNIYKVNATACEMFQQTEQEICAGGRNALVDLNDPKLPAALKEREKNGKARAALTFIRKDGSAFIGDITSALFNDNEGRIWTAMIIRDITKFIQVEDTLRKINEDILSISMMDDLTKVLNRKAFIEKFALQLNIAKHQNLPLSLILMDIDHFKQINDFHGHQTGDSVLKQVAGHLKQNLRPDDILGRYGGDEFIICLPNTKQGHALEIAGRLRYLIDEIEIQHELRVLKVTASFGVAFYNYAADETIDEIITRVDDMMYQAKLRRNFVYSI